jgi:hypothetical protein
LTASYRDRFVVPRLDGFALKHRHVRSVCDLKDEIERYPSPHEFVVQTLQYRHKERVVSLGEVANWLVGISGEGPEAAQLANLERWAGKVHYADYKSKKIRIASIVMAILIAAGWPSILVIVLGHSARR